MRFCQLFHSSYRRTMIVLSFLICPDKNLRMALDLHPQYNFENNAKLVQFYLEMTVVWVKPSIHLRPKHKCVVLFHRGQVKIFRVPRPGKNLSEKCLRPPNFCRKNSSPPFLFLPKTALSKVMKTTPCIHSHINN